jgi:hypothetical protein
MRSFEDGGLAQLGEHIPCTDGVRGSNPLASTKNFLKYIAECLDYREAGVVY